VPSEERLYETNLARAYRQRVEQQEREIDAAISGLEQLGRQRARLDAQVAQAVSEVDETETAMKACSLSFCVRAARGLTQRQKMMATGDMDQLAKAEGVGQRKGGLEDAINKLSMQKNVLIGQQMEEARRVGCLLVRGWSDAPDRSAPSWARRASSWRSRTPAASTSRYIPSALLPRQSASDRVPHRTCWPAAAARRR
jgi:hypothetical protein